MTLQAVENFRPRRTYRSHDEETAILLHELQHEKFLAISPQKQ